MNIRELLENSKALLAQNQNEELKTLKSPARALMDKEILKLNNFSLYASELIEGVKLDTQRKTKTTETLKGIYHDIGASTTKLSLNIQFTGANTQRYKELKNVIDSKEITLRIENASFELIIESHSIELLHFSQTYKNMQSQSVKVSINAIITKGI